MTAPPLPSCWSQLGCRHALFGAIVVARRTTSRRCSPQSTMSQIGYMVLAAGLGPPATRLRSCTRHARFFKATMFLGAGW